MNNDGFGTHLGSGDVRTMDGLDSIHIHIEDNETRTSPASIPNSEQVSNSFGPSSSLHSMLNRVRQHTIGNNIVNNSTEWRMNLNNLRTFISNSGSRYTRYTPLSTSPPDGILTDIADGTPTLPNVRSTRIPESVNTGRDSFHNHIPIRSNVAPNSYDGVHTQYNAQETRQPNRPSGVNHPDIAGIEALPAVPHARLDEDNNNVDSDIFIRVVVNFVRYLPFLAIVFVKFIHDHLLGILDIVLLQSVIYIVNKSLCNQVSKLSDKRFGVLLRDISLLTTTAIFRFLLTASSPDPFGLILSPPIDSTTLEISTTATQSTKPIGSDEDSTVTITKAISLGLLIYYVAVNDLFLKMLTILTKIFVTMLPNKLLRHKQRAQMYAVIEYLSQFYRALVPTRQWIMFLFKSYTGLEMVSGILFSAFYMGAKGFEFASRGKVLQKAVNNFIRNMDYERKPTKEELEAAGLICPICHDTYTTPIILSCNHIFCDECVGQWFKREQTCPMCRAKVSEDPQWQDGSTTFFYQLC